MPHIIIKIVERDEDDKILLSEALCNAMSETLNIEKDKISITIEDIAMDDWVEQVYKPDILGKESILYKKPGYKIPY
ncbi:tautomerase family protein [Pantoea cypripedii]|uniref:4-oxalocrotonate tautomerase n=1 Tax=Pantoea cypripedii TaxID=55209 RepID=A0A1X1EKS7_PANCY|nr:tautomerase family protein [Pantoea cypripedii]MBP2199009.1 4-oxalocrotonate tautomerase [Pantoea cypripedii]ORM89432.1 4-oxalocrotonate tautomerase [Pantoea cypripedii]